MKTSLQIKILTTRITKLAIVLMVVSSCAASRQNNPLTFNIRAFVNDLPLVLGTKRYQNLTGEGEFTVENFKFYISNIKLLDSIDNPVYTEPESYHLVSFDDDRGIFPITLDYDGRDFEKIQFSLGVDSLANQSISQVGDLDPNNSMAWGWAVGYKFLVLEGNYFKEKQAEIVPLVYHIGFSENYQTYLFTKTSFGSDLNQSNEFNIKIDMASVFNGSNLVSFDSLPSVTFNRERARQIGGNLKDVFSVMPW
jgi:hypothetical protein